MTRRLLAACAVTGAIAVVVALSAGSGRPPAAEPACIAIACVCAALVAHLLHASARALEEGRLDWMAAGATVALAGMVAKGLGLQYVLRGRFRDLWVHDTPATGFGCDFLQDTVVDAVLAERCGRLDNGEQPGGAVIGIGIGGWGITERLTVTACTARGNGTNGIFIELQQQMWPPPRGIRITACHVEDNRFGISDWGAEGMLVSACTMIGNAEAGFDVSSQGTAQVGGRGGILSGCIIDANQRDGVSIGNTPGPYTVRGNRISNNGQYGYREHDIAGGDREPAGTIVIQDNDVWGNGCDGIRLEAAMTDAFLLGNRVRSNGMCAGAHPAMIAFTATLRGVALSLAGGTIASASSAPRSV